MKPTIESCREGKGAGTERRELQETDKCLELVPRIVSVVPIHRASGQLAPSRSFFSSYRSTIFSSLFFFLPFSLFHTFPFYPPHSIFLWWAFSFDATPRLIPELSIDRNSFLSKLTKNLQSRINRFSRVRFVLCFNICHNAHKFK